MSVLVVDSDLEPRKLFLAIEKLKHIVPFDWKLIAKTITEDMTLLLDLSAVVGCCNAARRPGFESY